VFREFCGIPLQLFHKSLCSVLPSYESTFESTFVCFTEGTKIDTLVVHEQYVVSRTCTRSVSIFRYSTEHIYTCTYNKLRKYVSTKVPSKI